MLYYFPQMKYACPVHLCSEQIRPSACVEEGLRAKAKSTAAQGEHRGPEGALAAAGPAALGTQVALGSATGSAREPGTHRTAFPD